MRRVTLKDVAREAGLSVGMASRVLGNYGYFSEDSKHKVLAAARKLDYRRNAVAHALRVESTRVVGVLVSDLVTYHWTLFVRGVEEAASRDGYQVILCNTDDDPKKDSSFLMALLERGADGLIVSPSPGSHAVVRQVVATGVPIVMTGEVFGDLNIPKITMDDVAGGREAAAHLLELGHRRIGIITGSRQSTSGEGRLNGYLQAHHDAGIEVDPVLVADGGFLRDRAYSATAGLLDLAEPPTALFVCSETMSGGALQCLRDRRVTIPDDLSVVVFDDPDWASFMMPPLTAVRQPRYYMGTLAFEALRGVMSDPDGSRRRDEELVLKPGLVVRESTTPPIRSD